MQSVKELIEILEVTGMDPILMVQWIKYLSQLRGCHLYSTASPGVDKDQWLEHRKIGIGGSEIATLLGENKWSSPRQVWMSKLGIFESPQSQSEQARWGNILETTVATEWGVRNNRKWINIPVILQDDECPWMLANIDGFTLTDDEEYITGILEVKTTSEYNRDAWENGPIPYNYVCQTMWYCGITRLPVVEIACLVGGQKLFSHTIPFSQELFDKEKEVAKVFWTENILKGIEPAATDVDKELTKDNEHDESLPPVVYDDDESERIADAYCLIRTKIAELDKVKKALYAQIFLLLGKSTQGITKSHTFVIQNSARRSCNFDGLMEEYPEAYEKYVVTNISQSLNIK